MSYTFHIGEAKLEKHIDQEYEELWSRWTVNQIKNKKAPSFEGDCLSNNNNSRSPGYRQWANFCRDVGLYDLFYNEDNGIIREHPGCILLNKKHLKAFEDAMKKRKKIDKRPAGLDKRYIENEMIEIPKSEETHDYCKVRLLWLIWWTKEALKNCKNPAFANS